MGRRQQLSASALLLLAAGLLTRADAALLEAMSGCTLKPAQNLRVVRAEPTRLEFSFTSPPGTSPACVDHFVASIYEAGSIRPLFEDVVVAPPATPAAPPLSPADVASLSAPPQAVATFSFGDLDPAHEYRAIVTAVPSARAAADYARAVTHAAAVLVTVTPRQVVVAPSPSQRVDPLPGQTQQQVGGSSPSSNPPRTGRPVVLVMPPPSPRPMVPPPPSPAVAPVAPVAPVAAPAPKATTGRPPRGGPSSSSSGRGPTRPSGGRQEPAPQQPHRGAGGGQDFRPAGAAPERPSTVAGRSDGADAAAASAGSSAWKMTDTQQQQDQQQEQHKSGKHDTGVGSATLGSEGEDEGVGGVGGQGGDFTMVGAPAPAPTGRGRRRGGGRGGARSPGPRRANPITGSTGDSDDVLLAPPTPAPAPAPALAPTTPKYPTTNVTLEPWVAEALDFAVRQLAATVQDIGLDSPSVPRSAQAGVGVRMEEVLNEKGVLGWTTGFFPGSLWLLYEYLSVYAPGDGSGGGAAAAVPAAPVAPAVAAPVAAPVAPAPTSGRGRRRGGPRAGGRRAGNPGRHVLQEDEGADEATPSPDPPAPPQYPPIYNNPEAAELAAHEMLVAAKSFTDLMAPVQNVTTDHDVGFVAYCSYGQGLRVLREQERLEEKEQESFSSSDPTRSADLASYRAALLRSADSLATRFDPDVGATVSWDWWGKRGRDFPVIVDNMMNMELLFWAEKEHARAAEELKARAVAEREQAAAAAEQNAAAATVDKAAIDAADAAAADFEAQADLAQAQSLNLRRVAEGHLRTTLRNHFRNDAGGTAWHLVNYDPLTGKVWRRQNYQGYDDDSMWARGQGWALYGFSFAFRETGDRLFLRRAVRLADWLYSHPNMPSDGVPYWDFADPRIPDVPRDASAGALYASALYELSRYVRGDEGAGAAVEERGIENNATSLSVTFPVAPPEAEAEADARWALLSPEAREAAGEALRARLRGFADRTLMSLAAADRGYRATTVGADSGFVLGHSTGSMNEHLMLEIDVPISYGDYYFLEALLRKIGVDRGADGRRSVERPGGA